MMAVDVDVQKYMPARKYSRLTDSMVEEALLAAHGRVGAAAKMLNCAEPTLYRRLKKDPELKRRVDEAALKYSAAQAAEPVFFERAIKVIVPVGAEKK